MTDAAQRIGAERARDPRVVELAEAASLAARVEPELLRSLRLRCVPGADAAVEAELWFGPLAGVRSPGVLALDGEIVAELRRGVALDLKGPIEAAGARARVAAIAEVIARVHAGAPPLLRLEEEVIAGLVLGRDPAELDERLRGVLGAMAHQPARRAALASWAWAALPRLPLDHVALPAAGALAVATGLTMQEAMPGPARIAEGALAGVPAALASVTGTVELSVSRAGAWLVLAHAGPDVPQQRRIRVPATTPRYVEVATGSGDATLVALAPQGREQVRVDGAAQVWLRSLDGRAWEVTHARARPVAAPVAEVTVLCFRDLAQLDDESMAEEIERDLDRVLAGGARPALVLVGGGSGGDVNPRPLLPRFCREVPVLVVPGDEDGEFELSEGASQVEANADDEAEAMLDPRSEEAWRRAFHRFQRLRDAVAMQSQASGLEFELDPGSRSGCFTATLRIGEARIGVCGLNNWYLDPARVGDRIPDVDARLLPADIDRWCEEHDLTILLLGAAPERFRPHRRFHFEQAVARRGRFDLVLGAGERAPRFDVGAGRLDYAMLPGDRYAVLRLHGGGGQTRVQIWPRVRGSAGFAVDPELGIAMKQERVEVVLKPRKQPPAPLSHAAARTCFELLQDGRSTVLWGPGDSNVEETARRVMAHLERAGRSPLEIHSEEDLAAARAARVPQPVYCTRAAALRPRGGRSAFGEGFSDGFQKADEETFFYWLAASEDPRPLEPVARLVENADLTLDEDLARFSLASPEYVREVHQRAAGVIGVMDRFFDGLTEAELSKWLWQALATDDLGILAVYRSVLDGHPSLVTEIAAIEEWRLVASGLFRRDGTERNPWYRELLGHRWIDAQLERCEPLPPPRFVLVLGTSTVAQEVASALGARGRDYGLVVLGHEPEPQDALVRSFFEALPAAVSRASRVQVITDANAPAATEALALGATLVSLDGDEPQRIVEHASALVDASGSPELDGSHALIERAASRQLPIFHAPHDHPRDVARHALHFLDSHLQPPARK